MPPPRIAPPRVPPRVFARNYSPANWFSPFQQIHYTPNGWYWIVGNHNPDTMVFSGAAGDYIANDDAAYLQWKETNTATDIPTDGELADVLAASGRMPAMAVRNAGWTDWGYVPLVSQGEALLAAGVSIQSTATPALTGIYPIDDPTRLRINTNVDYIQRHSAFSPNLAATKDWIDVRGDAHTFTATQDYLNFATAVADYYAGVADWMAADGSGALPSEPVIIA